MAEASLNHLSRRSMLQAVAMGPVLSSPSSRGFDLKAKENRSGEYKIAIDTASQTATVRVKIPTDESITFNIGPWNTSIDQGNINLTIESKAEQTSLSGKYRVEPEDGEIFFKYSITDKAPGDCRNKVQPFVAIGEDHALFQNRTLFATPNIHRVSSPISVQFDVPEKWRVFTPFNLNETTFTIPDYRRLRKTSVIAGIPRFSLTTNYENVTMTNLTMFKPGNCIPGGIDETRFDPDPETNARQANKEISFYARQFINIVGEKPSERIIVSPSVALIWPPGVGMWHSNPERRHHHIARHIGGILYNTFLNAHPLMGKGLDHHLADRMVYDYTGDERMLGNRYFKFIVFMRAQEKLDYNRENDPTHNRIYVYMPVQALFLDHLIRKKSGGNYSAKDLKRYVVQNFTMSKGFRLEDVPKYIQRSTGVDVSEEFNQYILSNPGSLVEKYPEIRDQYYQYFDALLDHQQQFSKAPDILLYAFIELLTKNPHGKPSYLNIYMRAKPYSQQFTRGDFRAVQNPSKNSPLSDYFSEIKSSTPLSRDLFIDILNQYTQNRSGDFFEFYSDKAREPDLNELNDYLEGGFSRDSKNTGRGTSPPNVGMKLLVNSDVTLPEPGYAVLFEADDGKPTEMLARTKYLSEGSHANVGFYTDNLIHLDYGIRRNESLIVKKYIDNGNKKFDSLDAEIPLSEYQINATDRQTEQPTQTESPERQSSLNETDGRFEQTVQTKTPGFQSLTTLFAVSILYLFKRLTD